MTKVEKKIFEIIVWFRYVVESEQEQDYNVHEIEASNVQEAVNKASDLYRSHRAIPFQYLYKGEKHSPNNFTKEDIFNLTSPTV